MNEWLKKVTTKTKELWSNWKPVQKIIAVGIVAVVVIAIVVMTRSSSAPTSKPLIAEPIVNQVDRDKITNRLSRDQVWYEVDSTNVIRVKDEETARYYRTILIDEGLVPDGTSPWAFLGKSNWSTTDFERNANANIARKEEIELMIEQISDVSRADVQIGRDDDAYAFGADKAPVTAAVVLHFRNGSDMARNQRKIKTVQNLLLHSVSDLKPEYITISDSDGNQINDFGDMEEFDTLTLTEKTEKFKLKLANEYRAKVLKSLQQNFTIDRVKSVDVTVKMDTSKLAVDKTEITPIEMTPDNPKTPYSEREVVISTPVSSQTVTKTFTGTGYNPQGPAGVDGENPPTYADNTNVIGKSEEVGKTENYVFNQTHSVGEKRPQIDRITVAANIDGYWEPQTDEKGNYIIVTNKNEEQLKETYPDWADRTKVRFKKGGIVRVYYPVQDTVLEKVTSYVQSAVGFDESRGDTVSITSWSIPKDEEFDKADKEEIARANRKLTIMIVLICIVAILIAFIIIRFISRELERRKRLREEELLRRQQAEREKALWDAKQDGMEVTMSVEERKRAELQENAIAMAKEHPEDVAMLIRTWLMEDN